ncbi:four helix bundle protein [uncultured Proteiniphilum sp.]|nr:four helix bundle protein [uncultured Proteiniphilum sp.]
MTSREVSSFQSLIIWQKGHQFVLDISRMTGRFPEDERFGIVG